MTQWMRLQYRVPHRVPQRIRRPSTHHSIASRCLPLSRLGVPADCSGLPPPVGRHRVNRIVDAEEGGGHARRGLKRPAELAAPGRFEQCAAH